jgi:restriction endonuclease S subunit
LKGLEISIINLSECKSIIDFRIDSNTYKKDYLKSDILIKSKNPVDLESLSNSVQNFGAYSLCNFINFTEEGIPFLMTENVRHNYIDWNIRKYVDLESHKMLYKSHCHKGEVLVTMAGEYLGRVAVYDKTEVCSSNQAIAKVAIKEGQNPYIISTFLNSKHGQNQINRFRTITGQPNINMSLIKSLLIPEFSNTISSEVENLIKLSELKRQLSKETYQKAENLLFKEIELESFEPSQESLNVKLFSESFAVTGRIDAEYYQPKYEQVMNKITSRKHDTLSNIVNITKSIEPGSANYDEEGLPFMRVADFSKEGLTEPQKFLNSYFVNENKDKIKELKPKKGTILFSKDGSVGTAYHLRQDFNGITSSAILHLNIIDEKRIISEYLTLALNSKLVQMQAERDAGGSIILHWRVSEIENVVVPIIDFGKQKQIADLIEKSFSLKKQSEHLLEVAKKAVELAIEENEEKALEYIATQTTN